MYGCSTGDRQILGINLTAEPCCAPERPAHVLARAEVVDSHGQHAAGIQLDVNAPEAAASSAAVTVAGAAVRSLLSHPFAKHHCCGKKAF
jgi:hypothetical protein